MSKTGCLLLLLCAVLAGAVQAQSSGSVTISNLSYFLLDLDPNDGVAPSLTWDSTLLTIPSYALATSHVEGDDFQTVQQMRGEVRLQPVSAELKLDTGRSSSAMTGSLGSALVLEASRAIRSDRFYGTYAAEIHAGYISFLLSPMTAVTFRSDLALTGEVRPPPPGGLADNVSLMSDLIVRYDLYGNEYTYIDRETWSSSAVASTPPGNLALQLTMANTRADRFYNELALYGAVVLASGVSPVPEPAGWVMLLAGLMVLARRGARTRDK